MNAETKVENSNLAIWDALSRTDPAHTKSFSRAGGFKGTAIKPIWIVKMLTEQFGPCGGGWGIDEPVFQVVPCADEVMVYCTVKCWYVDSSMGGDKHCLHGVGGDKALAKRGNGYFGDDEAFKKAFTDAVGNAFKFLGVGADVHMGLFDDNKYVAEVAAEFAEPVEKVPGIQKIKDRLRVLKDVGNSCSLLEAFNEHVHTSKTDLETIRNANHSWWTGDGEDFEGFKAWIVRRRAELAEDSQLQVMIRSMKETETKRQLENWMIANETAIEQLEDADGRSFQLALAMHESAIELVDTAGG